MSIITWSLKAGDFVDVYSKDGKKHIVKITKEPHEHVANVLSIDFGKNRYGESHHAHFSEEKQQWETWFYKRGEK